jgi:hypothetical protein
LPNDFIWANDSTWHFAKLSLTLQQWKNSLVTVDIPSTADILQVESSQHLDAPMGTGKTHVAQQYLSRHPRSSILAVTFRISWAKYLSTRLSLNCYLENNIFNNENAEKWEKISICLYSIWKLKKDDYDIVL